MSLNYITFEYVLKTYDMQGCLMFYTYMQGYGLSYAKVSVVKEDGLRLCLISRPEICCNYNECNSALCVFVLCQLFLQIK